MTRIGFIFIVLILLAAPAFGAGDENRAAVEEMNSVVDKIYEQEHGARSKEILREEYIIRYMVEVGVRFCEEKFQEKEYERCLVMDGALQVAFENIKKTPKAHVPKDLLSQAYLCRGKATIQLFFANKEGYNVDIPISDFKKSNSYMETGEGNLYLASLYSVYKEDYKQADKYAKNAVKLEPKLKPAIDNLRTQVIAPGLAGEKPQFN